MKLMDPACHAPCLRVGGAKRAHNQLAAPSCCILALRDCAIAGPRAKQCQNRHEERRDRNEHIRYNMRFHHGNDPFLSSPSRS